jgi:hypothetical protein
VDEADLVVGIDLQSIQDRRQVIKDFPALADGSTHVVLEPLDFMARLAALVPKPRLNLCGLG